MTTFDDLVFEPHRVPGMGVQARAEFPNGFGVSVILGPNTYGGPDGLYELAVLKNGEITYKTPITNDVLGHLTPPEVTAAMSQVEALPADAESDEPHEVDDQAKHLVDAVISLIGMIDAGALEDDDSDPIDGQGGSFGGGGASGDW